MGEESQIIARYVKEHSDIPVCVCATHEEAAKEVLAMMNTGDWVLVKGSRGMQMDKVVEQLLIKE